MLNNAPDSFRIRSDVDLVRRNQIVKFKSIALLYKKIQLNANLHMSILTSMKASPVRYLVNRIAMRRCDHMIMITMIGFCYSYEIPTGNREISAT